MPVELGSHPSVARSGSEPTGSTGAIPQGTHAAGRWAGKGVSRHTRHHIHTADMQERSWFDTPAIKGGGVFQYSLLTLDQTFNFHRNTNLQVSSLHSFWMLPEPRSSPTRIN